LKTAWSVREIPAFTGGDTPLYELPAVTN